MDKYMDLYLSKVLKRWAARHRPHVGGRERLLQKAATPLSHSPNKFALSWLTDQEAARPDILGIELTRKLTGWLYLSFQPGYGNLTVV